MWYLALYASMRQSVTSRYQELWIYIRYYTSLLIIVYSIYIEESAWKNNGQRQY